MSQKCQPLDLPQWNCGKSLEDFHLSYLDRDFLLSMEQSSTSTGLGGFITDLHPFAVEDFIARSFIQSHQNAGFVAGIQRSPPAGQAPETQAMPSA